MATNTELLVSKNKGLRAKVEAAEGTYETMTDTDNIPISDLDWNLNIETEDNNEANFSLDEGPVAITGEKPTMSGSCLMRGGAIGSVAAPPFEPLLKACGWDPTAEALIPSSGSSTVQSGSTSTFVVDQATNSAWPSTDANVAKLAGRVVQFTANPSTGIALITSATIATGDITALIDRVMGSALGATTTLKLLACRLYRLINTGIVSVSYDCFLDGKVHRFKGGRGNSQFTIDGNAQARVKFDFKASFHADEDVALPAIATTISTLPDPPRWKDGDAYCDGSPVAVTSFDFNLQGEQGQHRDPNQEFGLLQSEQIGRKARGTIQFNTVTKATKDWLAKVRAGTEMTFSAVLNKNGATGERIAIMLPRMKFLGESQADFEGLSDTSRQYQAINGGTVTIF